MVWIQCMYERIEDEMFFLLYVHGNIRADLERIIGYDLKILGLLHVALLDVVFDI